MILGNIDSINSCPEYPGLTVITKTRSIWSNNSLISSSDVPGFIANPALAPPFLISKIVLVLKLEAVTDLTEVNWGYVNKIGHAIIDEISITIGQTEIDTHFGDWINFYHDLYIPY